MAQALASGPLSESPFLANSHLSLFIISLRAAGVQSSVTPTLTLAWLTSAPCPGASFLMRTPSSQIPRQSPSQHLVCPEQLTWHLLNIYLWFIYLFNAPLNLTLSAGDDKSTFTLSPESTLFSGSPPSLPLWLRWSQFSNLLFWLLTWLAPCPLPLEESRSVGILPWFLGFPSGREISLSLHNG